MKTRSWLGSRSFWCGSEPCYIPPILFIIHIVWGVFFFLAARNPLGYVSFLNFTMWGVLVPRAADGRAGSHAHGHPVAQILYGYPVRADPRPVRLSLATRREKGMRMLETNGHLAVR